MPDAEPGVWSAEPRFPCLRHTVERRNYVTDKQFLILGNYVMAAIVGISAVIDSLPEPQRALAAQKLIHWKNLSTDAEHGLAEMLDILVPADYAGEV